MSRWAIAIDARCSLPIDTLLSIYLVTASIFGIVVPLPCYKRFAIGCMRLEKSMLTEAITLI